MFYPGWGRNTTEVNCLRKGCTTQLPNEKQKGILQLGVLSKQFAWKFFKQRMYTSEGQN